MPSRIQLCRRRGWRMPDGAVKVDRSTEFGNPFRVECLEDGRFAVYFQWLNSLRSEPHEIRESREAALDAAVALHRDWLLSEAGQFTRRAAKMELAGKDLACWCRPDRTCHADALLEVANAER